MSCLSRIVVISIGLLFVYSGIGYCGEKIKGEALTNLISGKTVAGTRGKERKPFVRTFNSDGTWVASNPTKEKGTATGTWRISRGHLCIKRDKKESCAIVRKDGDKFLQVKQHPRNNTLVTSATWKVQAPDSEMYVTHHKKMALKQ